MYTLKDVFYQAYEEDGYAVKLDGSGYKAKMLYGIKIIQDDESGKVELLNAMGGGDYYTKVEQPELNYFLEKGWRYGVYVLSLSNYRTKLNMIEDKIQVLLSGRANQKTIQMLKTRRENILKKYTEINNKLNQLNYGNEVNNKEADNV